MTVVRNHTITFALVLVSFLIGSLISKNGDSSN